MEHIWILVWIGLMAFVARTMQFKRTVLVDGAKEERNSWLFALIAFLPVILVAGFRDDVGDTWMYRMGFLNAPTGFNHFSEYLSEATKDKGFAALTFFLKAILENRDVWYFLILAIIQGVILFSVYQKYSSNYIVSIFLFIASTDYISWMYNGIKQFLAVTLILAATKFLLSKKYIPLILVILLASTIHQSALIMIPIIFIVQGKAWNKRTLLFIALVLVAVFFLDSFTNILDDSLQGTQYTNVVSDYTDWNDDGTNPIRVLVYAIPTMLAIYGRKQIADSNSRLINICVNMSIVSTGIYIVSMVTSGIFIGRLPIYVSLYNYMLLPWEINHIVSPQYRSLFVIAMIMGYLLFYYYQMHFVSSLI